MTMPEFIDYCIGFYGQQGLYPMEMTKTEIERAVRLFDLIGQQDLELDSIGREQVRDIVRVMRGEKVSTKWEI
jgi:hypothetical protein